MSLVAEIDAPEEQAKEVIRALGRVFWYTAPPDRQRLLTRHYPACLVVGLTGIGAVGYEHGDYWSAVHNEAPGQVDQTLWGRAFRANLDHFRLARFHGLSQVNVGEILMHAGIPAYCLGDLLNLLLQRQSREPGLTGEGFLAWALAPGRESRLSGTDKPVQRFLQRGEDYAADLIDRCVDLLERLRQPAFNADGLGLSPHLIAKAQALAAADQLDWTGSSDRGESAAVATHQRPHLELEPYGRGLLVWLPPVHDATDGRVLWRLRFDGQVESVVSQSRWPGTRETAPATAVAVVRPARQVAVEPAGYDQEYELDVVDPRDPLLVFTADGRRVPATSGLPPEPVWLLYPQVGEGGGPLELRCEGDLLDTYDVPAPYGWLGWTLRHVDLREVSHLRLGDGTPRRVKGARRAQLQLAQPLPGVSSLAGAPVVATAPRLNLPTDPGVTTEWSVRIRRPGSGQLLHAESLSVGHDTAVDPWRHLVRPLVGAYEITVRGPLGRGLVRTLEFAEGLSARSNPSWREVTADGLEPVTVRADTTLPGLSVMPALTELGPADTAVELQLDSLAGAATVRVMPAHMAIQRLGGGSRGEWSLQPLRLDTETIGEGELLVRLPRAADARLIVRSGGRELQTVPSGATYGQPMARFSLAAIADTVGAHGLVQLDVRFDGQDFPAARCVPRRLASTVHIEGGRLVLVDGVRAEGLTAALYRVYAPWERPYLVHLGVNMVSDPLPTRVTTAGPLVALLRIEDPWLPSDWPEWPGRDNAFELAELKWQPAGQDPAGEAVSAYLAGVGALPERPEIAPLLFDLYPRADDLRARGVTANVRGAAGLLRPHPAAALAALTKHRASADQVVAPLVHSGLIALPPDRYVSTADEARLWTASPLAAMLASAHRLPDLAAQVDLREQVAAVCGEVAAHLLAGGSDPYETVGRFDQSAEVFALLPAEERDRVWRAMRVVPGGLLDADERMAAARHLFEVRVRPGLGRLSSSAEGLLRALQKPLVESGGPRVVGALQARNPTRGWLALPALSLAFAFVARLAARGHAAPAGLLPRTLPPHATLARSAPRLVAIDLLLAEFLLTGAGVAE
ncbi:hypothetical protein C1I93_00120 [Micromonospora endophytica]|uniref:Uncharacterized protein n=1 Tax=Micromonospora endophytica TaxID=515350 RepID=A0A2W2DB36_9ACTN|nr:hypothetical protein C1I93_00120 [Micromonospora endophytica]RIW42123.1 hypothetical protein D3H59_24000 [Micromonospora endophytica]